MENSQNVHDESNNIWNDARNGNYWDDYEDIYPSARKIWLMGIWSEPYNIPGGNNQDMYPLFRPYMESSAKVNLKAYIPNLSQFFEQIQMSKQTFTSNDGYFKTFK